MSHYLYQITNKLNGRIYIGAHTGEYDDDYYGSGKIIGQAHRKYGLAAFEKTVIETFETSDEMFAKERSVVNEEFLARPDVYNIALGGYGGPRPNSGAPNGNTNRKGKTVPFKARPKAKGRVAPNKGQPHSEDAKVKMRAAKLGKHWKQENEKRVWYVA